ncbi:MAG: glycosyltransferase family 2 protein [Lachnospiraceae bacterium]|nr:glycosyltransferase family 2 protein [Lachnospiraceae bacterium]
MPKISIIIPAYNVEDYIVECVESVVNQTLQDIEIIVVDDGSTDSTGRLLDEMAEKDSRLIVIHKENGGVTSARNTGIERAKGEFIGFVDGDDYIAENMYEEVYNLAKETGVDVVSTQKFYMVGKNSIEVRQCILEEGIYSKSDKSIEYVYNNIWNYKKKTGIAGTLWCYTCKKDKFWEIQKKVPLDMKNSEDVMAVYALMSQIDSICITGVPFYYYRLREDSAIHSIQDYYMSYWNKVYVFVKEYFENHYMSDVLMKQLKYRVTYGIHSMRFIEADIKRFFMFPYEMIVPETNVIIYGAGDVGKSYYKQIEQNNYCNIVAWVDKNYKKFEKSRYDVRTPGEIKNQNYDFILIAVANMESAENIAGELVDIYEVDREKLILHKPRILIDFFDL